MIKAVQTKYTCPICEDTKHKLLIVMEPLDYGDVKVLLRPVQNSGKDLWFEFDIRESNFFYCSNCRIRFSRVDPTELPKYKATKIPNIFTDCIIKECREDFGGRIGTYKDVAVGKIYIKGDDPKLEKRRKRVAELLERADIEEIPDAIDHFLSEFTGEFTLDQAGICNECGIVIVKEVDLK
jgi:hypothetical protein